MRRGRRGTPASRIVAPSSDDCPRCGRPFGLTRDMVKTRWGTWIHKSCASGADDE